MSYDDTILLKLVRQHSESEAVHFIAKKLSECQIEIGKLKSEIAEKDFIIDKYKNGKIKSKNTFDEQIMQKINTITRLKRELNECLNR